MRVGTGSTREYPPYPPGTKPALWLRIPRSVMGCPSRSGLAGTFQLCSSASPSLSRESCPCSTNRRAANAAIGFVTAAAWNRRSEEHPSELQSLMRISYAVLFLQKQTNEDDNY